MIVVQVGITRMDNVNNVVVDSFLTITLLISGNMWIQVFPYPAF